MVLQDIIDGIKKIITNDKIMENEIKFISFLNDIGVSKKEVINIKNRVKRYENKKYGITKEIHRLFNSFGKIRKFKHNRINIVLFTGLQGSGKTTTICKYGRYYKNKSNGGYNVGIIAGDTFRAGAIDQLISNCDKLGLSCYWNRKEFDPLKIICNGVKYFKEIENKNLILIDTSGKNYQDMAIFKELRLIKKCIVNTIKNISLKTIFIADGTNGNVLFKQVKEFKKFIGLDELIITKLDGLTKETYCVLSITYHTKLPISFITDGEDIKKNFQKYNSSNFLYGVTGINDFKDGINVGKRFFKRKNTFGDLVYLCKKFANSLDMFGKFLPNVNQIAKVMNKIVILSKSMTYKELYLLKYKNVFTNKSIIKRLVIGSGLEYNEIDSIFKSYSMLNKMLGNMQKKFNIESLFNGNGINSGFSFDLFNNNMKSFLGNNL